MDFFKVLFDILVMIVDWLVPFTVVDQWERGLVLTWGKPRKVFWRRSPVLKPGFHFVWPFKIERVVTEDVYDKVAMMPPQSLTTADGVGVAITPIVLYRVKNLRKVILKSGGHEEAIVDAVAGVIGENVMGVKWSDLTTEEFRATLKQSADERASHWGVEVLDVRFRDLVRTRTYRLLQENH